MASPDLVKKLKKLSKHFRGISRIYEIPKDDGPEKLRETIYELICYFFIARNISTCISGCKSEVIPGKLKITFGHGSNSKKGNFSFIKISNINIAWKGDMRHTLELYHATRIEDIFNDKSTPDVVLALQSDRGELSHDKVIMIWDAKYRKHGSNASVTDSEIGRFRDYVEALEIGKDKIRMMKKIVTEPFEVPLMITNGKRSEKPEGYFIKHGFSILECFNDSLVGTSVFPTNTRHLSAG